VDGQVVSVTACRDFWRRQKAMRHSDNQNHHEHLWWRGGWQDWPGAGEGVSGLAFSANSTQAARGEGL